jgi:hypothetical protein
MTQKTHAGPGFVRLALTEQQKTQLRTSVGLEADSIELSVSELEERIAPFVHNPVKNIPM